MFTGGLRFVHGRILKDPWSNLAAGLGGPGSGGCRTLCLGGGRALSISIVGAEGVCGLDAAIRVVPAVVWVKVVAKEALQLLVKSVANAALGAGRG